MSHHIDIIVLYNGHFQTGVYYWEKKLFSEVGEYVTRLKLSKSLPPLYEIKGKTNLSWNFIINHNERSMAQDPYLSHNN
jgi:hypothetical protein